MSLARVVIPPVEGKTAQFDIMDVDQEAHRLFAADMLVRGVDVVDTSTSPGHYLQTVPLDAAPAGLQFVPELKRLYVAGADSTVTVINADPAGPHPYAVITKINTNGQGTADLMDYDTRDKKLYVTNPDVGFLSAIDVVKNVVVAQIQNLGALQQPRYDSANGMLYVLNTDNNSIMQIDPRTDALVHEYVLPVVCQPHGLAINPATNQGLIGCGDKDNIVTLAWDFTANRMIASFDLAGGGDAVIFDQKAQHFYFAAYGYTPAEVAVFNASPITFLTAVPTSHRSRTVAYDELNNLVYTFDGKHFEGALWAFPDPVAGCIGREAQQAAAGAPGSQTPHCHPESFASPRKVGR
jgi:DNA-binding beta-propeller fold protein YncE